MHYLPTKRVWAELGLGGLGLCLAFSIACSSAEEGEGRGRAPDQIEPIDLTTGSSAGNLGGGSASGSGTSGPRPATIQSSANQCDDISILFVLDGSGSMCETFGSGTRWSELRSALVGTGGVIPQLDTLASFGMLLYDGSIDIFLSAASPSTVPPPACAGAASGGRAMAQECTQFIEVPPAGANGQAIEAMFPAQQLGGSTPTDRALKRAFEMLIEERGGGVDLRARRQYIILATDGQPNDICVGGMGGDGTVQEQAVLQLVQDGAAMGVTTFVVSLASGDPRLQAHLDQVAKAGDPSNAEATTYNPSTPDALVQDIMGLLANALSCQLQ